LDDSTAYSYSLEVVRGVVPADDPDKIVIRIIGGASKRYPGQVSTLPDGSISMPGLVVAPGFVAAEAHHRPLRRIAIIGDSIASSGSAGGFLEFAIMACGGQLSRVVNAGIGGNTLAQMDARFVTDLQPFAPDEIWISGGLNSTELTAANKAAWASMVAKARNMSARPVIFAINPRTASPVTRVDTMNNWLRAFCASAGVEFCDPWDVVRVQATGLADASKLDGLGIHPTPNVAWAAGSEYGSSRVQTAVKRHGAGLNTNGDTYQNSWVIDPYNTTGDAAKGSRWTAENASVTFSKAATTSPDFGVWQRMAVSLAASAGANSGASVLAPGGMAIPEGTEFEISYRLKTSSMSGLTVDCYLEWQNDGLADVGGGRKSFLSALRADVDGVVSYILKAPAGAYRPQLKFKFTQTVDGAAATGNVDVAMIAIRSLEV
jgi:hypothetical protein